MPTDKTAFAQDMLSECQRLIQSAELLMAGRIGIAVNFEDKSVEAAADNLERAKECLELANKSLSEGAK